jgi:carbonic anhydrase/acetyltransferase-like protein (isoleucine patch superfamily)
LKPETRNPMHQWPDITDRLQIDAMAYVSPRAYVGGTVTIGAESSVWPMAVIRGDEGAITIGSRTNVQDGCILHADSDAYLQIGDDVTLGHGAIVHGCTIESGVLIGMGAVVLNHAVIGSGSIVAARALVPEGMVVPPDSLVMGVPGTIRPLRAEQRARIDRPKQHYVALARLYRERDRRE